MPLAQRILAHGPARVVGHAMDIRREKALVSLVDARRDVGPPKERLDERGAVVRPHLQLDEGAAGMEADAVHPFHPRHRIVVAAPDGHAAVGVLLDLDIDRHEGGRTMMLRPVELDSAGNPRPGEAHQRRLDNRLAVKEIVSIGLVQARVDASAEFRQDHHSHELILDMHSVPFPIRLPLGDAVEKWQRIDRPAAPLVNPLFQEHRVLVGRQRFVGWDYDGLAPGTDGRVHTRRALIKIPEAQSHFIGGADEKLGFGHFSARIPRWRGAG